MNTNSGLDLQLISQLATLGAASFWAIGLYLLFQFFFDSHKNPGDRNSLKVLVCWIGIFDTVRQAYTVHQASAGTLWGNLTFRPDGTVDNYIDFGDRMLYLCSALVSIPSQGFFVYRMWQFTGRRMFIPVLAIPPLLFQFVFPIALLLHKTSGELYLFIATCASSAMVDIATCIGLTALLWRRYLNRDSTLKSTSSMLLRLMLLSINTGMWTTFVALFLIVMLIITAPAHEQPFLGYYHLLSPMYFATVLINLNSREYIRRAGDRGLSNIQTTVAQNAIHPSLA